MRTSQLHHALISNAKGQGVPELWDSGLKSSVAWSFQSGQRDDPKPLVRSPHWPADDVGVEEIAAASGCCFMQPFVCQDQDLEIKSTGMGWSSRTWVTSWANSHISRLIHDELKTVRVLIGENQDWGEWRAGNIKSVELKINSVERFWGFVYWMWSG